jgi:serine/threonine protein kinase
MTQRKYKPFNHDKYDILSTIGEGFQAKVYLVANKNPYKNQDLYALKVVNKASLDEDMKI